MDLQGAHLSDARDQVRSKPGYASVNEKNSSPLKLNEEALKGNALDMHTLRTPAGVGGFPACRLEAGNIRKQMDAMASKPAAVNNMLKVLRAVMKFGVDRGHLKADPTIGVRMLRYRSEGFHSWTELEIVAFEERWPLGTRERLAFDLLLYTAQRSGDVRVMTRQQVQEGRVHVRQAKTGQLVDIPMHAT